MYRGASLFIVVFGTAWVLMTPLGGEQTSTRRSTVGISPSPTTTTAQKSPVTTTTAFDWESVEGAVEAVETYIAMFNPPPAPAPAPAPPAPVVVAPGEYEALISEFFPGNEAWARRVIGCESGYNARAVNSSSGTRGLFQIHPGWFDGRWGSPDPEITGLYVWDDMYQARANVHTASIIFNRNGGGPWSCK